MPSKSQHEINLGGTFRLLNNEHEIDVPINLPGDVHSALIEAGKIPDPYFGNNELDVMWVNQTGWTVERSFDVPADVLGEQLILTLSEVDCIADIYVNDSKIHAVDNQFIRHDIDVTDHITSGTNSLRIVFENVRDVAKERHDAHPFPIPFAAANQPHMAHINFVRKTACHGGWDWGICLMPTGVYGDIRLRKISSVHIESVQVEQFHEENSVALKLKTRIHAVASGEVNLTHKIDGQITESIHKVTVGENELESELQVQNPKLWWPSGQGEQPLYHLQTEIAGERFEQQVGLRNLEWVIEKDEIDHSFKCRVNGRDIFMMGANWIPADAIPSRITPETVRDILQSAVDANMNMIRVWGGGQYEPDYFYEICDELGILVWQDFMFSCMPYPSDPTFLASVETEITQQVRRLQHHACVAIWCGDNEVIGSLNWYPETLENRDRHVANYDRLSSLLQSIVSVEDTTRVFWPSSPSLGYMDFADGWHIDTRGDMHYWDVWHSAKPFEAYRTVNPRFASEFGFQSFTSMNVIDSFTNPEDRNPSSPVMEGHQRNEGGNARILETMCRYFRFPKNFEQIVFLSQVQQGLAIKTAIEYWRSTKPRCMGTLYWQINDNWPVHSWSSLDHGGQWKPLHYMAKRFFNPISLVAVPIEDEIELRLINDSTKDANVQVEVSAWTLAGEKRTVHSSTHPAEVSGAKTVATVKQSELTEDEFLVLSWLDADGNQLGEGDYFPRAYKYYDVRSAEIRAQWRENDGEFHVTLETDWPTLFVTLSVKTEGRFSDNGFTLLPGSPRELKFIPKGDQELGIGELSEGLSIAQLGDTY